MEINKMKSKFRKGQKLVCVHYKDKPIVKFEEQWKDEIWVKEITPKIGSGLWWGPESWFKKVKK